MIGVAANVLNYNTGRYLPACLDSLTAQTLRPRVTLIQEASVPQGAELKKKAALTALAGLLAFGAVAVWIGWREHKAARIDSAQDSVVDLELSVVERKPWTL